MSYLKYFKIERKIVKQEGHKEVGVYVRGPKTPMYPNCRETQEVT